VQGTTGTQASFMQLFQGDHEKVKELDREAKKHKKPVPKIFFFYKIVPVGKFIFEG